MKKVMICVGLLYGTYWYASRKFDFDDTLKYAHSQKAKSWSPAANYWIGMVYYQRNEYLKAQGAFQQLLDDHERSDYHDKALLRLSEVSQQMRDWSTARTALERFLQDYPGHKQRNIAEQRYEVIKFK